MLYWFLRQFYWVFDAFVHLRSSSSSFDVHPGRSQVGMDEEGSPYRNCLGTARVNVSVVCQSMCTISLIRTGCVKKHLKNIKCL